MTPSIMQNYNNIMQSRLSSDSNVSTNFLEPRSRAALRCARRVVIKAGTSVIANEDGSPSLTRLGAIVEQIAELNHAGVEVLFVASGAVGMGKNLLRKQARLNMTFKDLHCQIHPTLDPNTTETAAVATIGSNHHEGLTPSTSICDLLSVNEHMETSAAKSYAAAGQFELMSLFNALMHPKGVTASQILLTQNDFNNEHHVKNLQFAIERLLALGIVPIFNENDAVSVLHTSDVDDTPIFSDNDSLAALCAKTFSAEVLVLLTDVEGVYDKPPSHPQAKVIPYFHDSVSVQIGSKSNMGRGGMQAKITAAQSAVAAGSACAACVIASGSDLGALHSILAREYSPEFGPPKGTLFASPGSDLAVKALEELVLVVGEESGEGGEDIVEVVEEARRLAQAARREARKLVALPLDERRKILYAVADALVSHADVLLSANQKDLEAAESNSIDAQLLNRLKLTPEKLHNLQAGVRQLADIPDPLGVVRQKRELSDGLELSLSTVPIGVLLVIFESRPDSFPQIASLSLASGNGLLLKGGKEAAHSNEALHRVIGDAIETGSNGTVSREIIALVTSRGQVKDLLSLDDAIDLVIPRGSNALVSYISAHTHIPVLGHADGVCHCYVDRSANAEDAVKIVVDAKTDYPSACNAMETLLLHRETVENGVALTVLHALRSAGVKCLGGKKAMDAGLSDIATDVTKCEYGDLTCLVEVVESMDEAIEWIHENGSGHTETIVCEPGSPVGEGFLRRVDAACVFLNASSRFADGYRFGLGAEVGISTGRIHARGPVGVEGLLTTKWTLRSQNGVSYVGEFAGEHPSKVYTHKNLM